MDDAANTLDCSFNNMTYFPQHVLPRTEQLIMDGNKLDKLENENHMLAEVKMFKFKNCNIKSVQEATLKSLLQNAKVLDMRSNKLTSLSSFFETQRMETKLWLGNNPYECNCDMIWISVWLQNATNIMDKENISCAGKWKGRTSIKT